LYHDFIATVETQMYSESHQGADGWFVPVLSTKQQSLETKSRKRQFGDGSSRFYKRRIPPPPSRFPRRTNQPIFRKDLNDPLTAEIASKVRCAVGLR
jgi:hypothetical protein